SKAEVYLWNRIREKKIKGFRFRRQFSIGNYILDFYCPELKLAVEVDGATHLTNQEIEQDKFRQESLENLGINFLRFTNTEIYGYINEVIDAIQKKVKVLAKET
ncbi:MAG: endonuclease domain-containing protein, partial [Ignavibacteria bacterium]